MNSPRPALPAPVFMNKVLLAHSYPYPFTSCKSCVQPSYCDRDLTYKLKIPNGWLFTEYALTLKLKVLLVLTGTLVPKAATKELTRKQVSPPHSWQYRHALVLLKCTKGGELVLCFHRGFAVRLCLFIGLVALIPMESTSF